ncbi:cobalamin biosynthesis protein [Sulfitobacter mediterraneus]|uniref:adenosylcobinamide-phosphate synthase CbiB n=1 Tax=Sulfitobacter mediterraneus TaxID=83219 RepID=UPI001931EC41|nr:adenosylcobinamide-phosphate synthase CbiB [Sulfitobacter mediterraneus]MBM1633401.1 cobalamin biosynthesis protein [Sulfitobacter mediterraneus]MBM1640465.1 cobalamin biosynthesis protein [Sulfitobacter mediterraneus]MBM1645266.1 cobalamin biosynthesis protein [Sulfitobacter mediterraneus]MBM1648585.1 cobalamin biosynthesis protein [Sulfitobacter mediterraneus]MBM1652605.1 cobalamin biosynthesis protein [Sulfitobacter mediterraneus]
MTMAGLLIIAMVLDAILGEPKWLWQRVPHPAVLMGRVVGWLDERLNTGNGRKAKGLLALLLLILLGYLIGQILAAFGPVAEIATAAVLLAQRSLVQHVQKVADGLRMSVQQGRRNVAMIVSRDTTAMDGSAVARSAIESAAENLSDGVIAPAFWFLIGGLPGLLIYKFVNTADSMIGYRTPRHEQFGWAAARMDDLLNLLPARLTALFIALPAGAVGQWRLIRSDAAQHKSPNAGWPEAAMARAIDVALAGPRTYDGVTQQFAWVHSAGSRNIGPIEIDAAIARLWHAWAVMLGAAILLCLLTS